MTEIERAGLSRAAAHIARGLDIIQELLSHPHDTIEDNDGREDDTQD